MPRSYTFLRVLVASPSDVEAERIVLAEVVEKFNSINRDNENVRLELVRWESDTHPAVGADPQEVINKQIGEDYDIFLGIMWARFGSQTPRADSGTEEEFDRAYKRWKANPRDIRIMFYFKKADIPMDNIDPEQFSKVRSFKSKLSDQGALYHEFATAEDFRDKVTIHLSSVVGDWIKSNQAEFESRAEPPKDKSGSPGHDPLANLTSLNDHGDDESLIELIESGEDEVDEVTEILNRIANVTSELGNKIHARTAELSKHVANAGAPEIKTIKRISNRVSEDFELYVTQMSSEIPRFQSKYSKAMDTFGRIAMLVQTDFQTDSNQSESIQTLHNSTLQYQEVLKTASDSVRGFQNGLAKFPRMTAKLNRARNRTIAILADLLKQFEIASDQAQGVELLLMRTQMRDSVD